MACGKVFQVQNNSKIMLKTSLSFAYFNCILTKKNKIEKNSVNIKLV